jgi:FG-GAP-like repeat
MQMTTPATNFVQRSSERLALFLIPLIVGWFAFSERAHAVNPPADGGYVEGDVGPFEFGVAIPDAPPKRYDFNRDTYPDYVLYKPIGNQSAPLLDWPPLQTAIWYLQNNRRVAVRNGPEISSRWVVADAADFNRDRYPDYALFNIDNGDTKILYLNNNLLVGRAPGPRVPNGWRLQKVGEFNGDGKPDYVIVNSTTRQTQIWYMNNIHIISQGPGPTLPSGWDLRAVADFNGDGLDDYLLFTLESGRTEIWYIVGRNRVRQANGPTVPRPWRLRGAADFNRDGHPDYLIYQPNQSPKKTGIWYMNDNARIGAALGPPIQSPWNILLPSGSG